MIPRSLRLLRQSSTASPTTLNIFSQGDASVPQVLVTRPQKGVFWGKGGQYIKVQKVRFLETELVQDIKVIDVSQYSKNHLCSTAITGLGQTPRHISKVFNSLVKAVTDMQMNEGEVPGIGNLCNPGCRTSEWQLLSLKDLFVHLMTADYKTEMDLEELLKNPPTTKDQDRQDLIEFEQYYNKGRRKR